MSMNKLDEIIAQEYGCNDINEVLHDFDISPAMIKQCMIEFAKHILEEAAENVKMYNANDDCHYEAEDGSYPDDYRINKQSITDTLNKYL